MLFSKGPYSPLQRWQRSRFPAGGRGSGRRLGNRASARASHRPVLLRGAVLQGYGQQGLRHPGLPDGGQGGLRLWRRIWRRRAVHPGADGRVITTTSPGSFGFQFGAQARSIVIMFMTQEALDQFLPPRRLEGWRRRLRDRRGSGRGRRDRHQQHPEPGRRASSSTRRGYV